MSNWLELCLMEVLSYIKVCCCCCCSITKLCPTLFDPMDCSTPGFPVLHCLLEFTQTHVHCELPWWLNRKEFACNSGDLGSNPGSGRRPGEGNGYPLQYSWLENSMDRGDWQATQSIGSQRVRCTYTYVHTYSFYPKNFLSVSSIFLLLVYKIVYIDNGKFM